MTDYLLSMLTLLWLIIKDAAVFGILVWIPVHLIALNRGFEIGILEVIGGLFCILLLQFLLSSKDEIYRQVNNSDMEDDDE